MTDSVGSFLATQGLEIEENEFAHYGVKGMKWGKSRADTDGDGLVDGGSGGGEPLLDTESTIKTKITMGAVGGSVVLEDSTVTYKKQGRLNKFIESLFDHKVGSSPDSVTRNSPPRTTVKQGTINKFIEGAFNNAQKLVTPDHNSRKRVMPRADANKKKN